MPRSGSKGDPDYDYEEKTGNEAIQTPSSRNIRLIPPNPDNISREGVVVQRGQKLVQQMSEQESLRQSMRYPATISQSYQGKPLQRNLLSVSDRKTFRSRKLMAEKALSGKSSQISSSLFSLSLASIT
jgi:hypothetical protein